MCASKPGASPPTQGGRGGQRPSPRAFEPPPASSRPALAERGGRALSSAAQGARISLGTPPNLPNLLQFCFSSAFIAPLLPPTGSRCSSNRTRPWRVARVASQLAHRDFDNDGGSGVI